jgi:hypothetical protein
VRAAEGAGYRALHVDVPIEGPVIAARNATPVR